MAKIVMLGKNPTVNHLEVNDRFKSTLCMAVETGLPDGPRTSAYGDVTCTQCKRILRAIAENVVATGPKEG